MVATLKIIRKLNLKIFKLIILLIFCEATSKIKHLKPEAIKFSLISMFP